MKACGISNNCRHLLAAAGKGFVFRFEYVRPAAPQDGDKENAGANGADEKALAADDVAPMET